MRSRLRRGFGAVAAIAIAVALLAVSMTSPILSTSADFSIFNSGWNGTSELAVLTYKAGKFSPTFEMKSSGTEVTVEQLGLADLQLSPTNDALIVIGPTRAYSSSEGVIAGDFVRAGGILLLADDFGSGNSLLEGMNATSRISKDLVMDLAFNKQPEFSVCFDIVQGDPATKNVTTLLLNYPSSIIISPGGAEVLARSSVASWRDTNGDRLQEWGEPWGPFPILARERMGSGEIILLSDPSVLINGMRKNMDNGAFGTSLVSYLCQDRSAVLFDESHRDFFDPVAMTLRFTGEVSDNAKIAFVALAFVLALWVSTDLVDRSVLMIVRRFKALLGWMAARLLPASWLAGRPKKAEEMDPAALQDAIAKKHPEWRLGLIRYLMREGARHREARKERL